jgi:hypothetical protein
MIVCIVVFGAKREGCATGGLPCDDAGVRMLLLNCTRAETIKVTVLKRANTIRLRSKYIQSVDVPVYCDDCGRAPDDADAE